MADAEDFCSKLCISSVVRVVYGRHHIFLFDTLHWQRSSCSIWPSPNICVRRFAFVFALCSKLCRRSCFFEHLLAKQRSSCGVWPSPKIVVRSFACSYLRSNVVRVVYGRHRRFVFLRRMARTSGLADPSSACALRARCAWQRGKSPCYCLVCAGLSLTRRSASGDITVVLQSCLRQASLRVRLSVPWDLVSLSPLRGRASALQVSS